MRIAFAWPEFPDYAARCIRALVDRTRFPVTVVASRASVPIEGMERSLGQSVNWIDSKQKLYTWSSLGLDRPDVLFVGGYSLASFNALSEDVRQYGGKVVLMSDNNWTGTLRQKYVDPFRHRLLLRRRFDSIFVPGASGEHVASSWGYGPGETATGLYGADPTLFYGGGPLLERRKTFLFVGQFIDRKNVLGLVEAFLRVADLIPDWTLSLCGNGPLVKLIPDHPRIAVNGFVQPSELAERLRNVRCLVLPSLEEHWGLVVHEAALSGCVLALTDTVGAGADLAGHDNAVLFPGADTDAIGRALLEIAAWNNARWVAGEAGSRERAAQFGPNRFAEGAASLVIKLTGKSI